MFEHTRQVPKSKKQSIISKWVNYIPANRKETEEYLKSKVNEIETLKDENCPTLAKIVLDEIKELSIEYGVKLNSLKDLEKEIKALDKEKLGLLDTPIDFDETNEPGLDEDKALNILLREINTAYENKRFEAVASGLGHLQISLYEFTRPKPKKTPTLEKALDIYTKYSLSLLDGWISDQLDKSLFTSDKLRKRFTKSRIEKDYRGYRKIKELLHFGIPFNKKYTDKNHYEYLNKIFIAKAPLIVFDALSYKLALSNYFINRGELESARYNLDLIEEQIKKCRKEMTTPPQLRSDLGRAKAYRNHRLETREVIMQWSSLNPDNLAKEIRADSLNNPGLVVLYLANIHRLEEQLGKINKKYHSKAK